MSSFRWSRFTRLALLVCIAILLIASLDQVEAKKKKKKKTESTAESIPASTAAAAAAAPADVDASDIDISAALAAKKNKDKAHVHTHTHTHTQADTNTNTNSETNTNTNTNTGTNSEASSQSETETVSAARIRRAKSAAVRAKRLEKRAKAAATRIARAQQQNQQLSQRRRSRAEQVSAYHARQQAKLDRANKAKIAADHPDNRKKGQDKLNWMNKQSASSSTRVISVDADSFRHYVNEGPRPYWVFLVFTSLLQQKPVCHQCHDALSQYVPLSVAHHEHRKSMPTATVPALYFDPNNTHAQANEQNMPVFFVQVEASRTGNLFQTLKLSGVPSIMLVPPRPAPGGPSVSNFFSQVAPRQRFQLNQPRFEASGFNTFINKHAGILVNLDQKKVDMSDVLMGALILISVGVLIYLWLTGRIVLKIQRHSFVMLAWFMYMYCISGGMYNIIRGTQWASYEQGGKVSYIHPHFRDQHSSEGFMMGLLQLICGLMLTLLVARAFDSGDETSTSSTSSTISPSSSSSSSCTSNAASSSVRSRRWHQHVATLILQLLSPTACVAIGLASWMQLTAVYRMKSHG